MAEFLTDTLLLIPTAAERRNLSHHYDTGKINARIELCGFGPVAAAARTAFLIDRLKPRRIVLAGIAGTYDASVLDVGQAAAFNTVALYGVGVGTGPEFQWASEIGFDQWPGESEDEKIREHIDLVAPTGPRLRLLLSCCAASSRAVDVEDRLTCSPGTLAEDMEGFGVAMACKMAGVPVAIVRGISNRAGDRNTKEWKIEEALRATWPLTLRVIESFDDWEFSG